MRASRLRRAGFTLLELMIVVVIIAVVSALAAPGIVNTLRENKTYQGASDVARFYRQARLDAVGRGTAVAVRYNLPGSGRSRFDIFRSPVSSCNLTNWVVGTPSATDATLHTTLDFNQAPYVVAGSNTEVRVRYCPNITAARACGMVGPTTMWICYTPAGRIYWSSAVNPNSAMNNSPVGTTIAGGWPFLIERWDLGLGAAVGVARVAFVPYGASGARVQQ